MALGGTAACVMARRYHYFTTYLVTSYFDDLIYTCKVSLLCTLALQL